MEGLATANSCARPMIEKKAKPQEQLNCPRCNSTNTKFCYYNNYSLTQPRYFCKTCRRYWTEGGSLRNVPVGGGSRKNKKLITSSSSSSSPSSSSRIPDLNPPNILTSSHITSENPKSSTSTHEGFQDINLACPTMDHSYQYHHGITQYIEVPKLENNNANINSTSSLSSLELVRSTGVAYRGHPSNPYISTLMPSNSNTLYSPGFQVQEFKPNLGFTIDGLGNRHVAQESNSGRSLMFSFGEMKPLSAGGVSEPAQNKGQAQGQGNSSTGPYWNEMIGEGSW